jgi:hypothetical protein
MYGSAEKVTRGQDIHIQGEELYCNVSMVEVSTRSILYSDPHKSLPVGFPYNHALRGSDALDRLVYSVCVCILRAEKCGPLLICIN